MYVLPKIHKQQVNGVYPSRPIISGIGNATEKISHFVDEHLKPLVPLIDSYVRDTTDFISKIENISDLPDRFFLVTLMSRHCTPTFQTTKVGGRCKSIAKAQTSIQGLILQHSGTTEAGPT